MGNDTSTTTGFDDQLRKNPTLFLNNALNRFCQCVSKKPHDVRCLVGELQAEVDSIKSKVQVSRPQYPGVLLFRNDPQLSFASGKSSYEEYQIYYPMLNTINNIINAFKKQADTTDAIAKERDAQIASVTAALHRVQDETRTICAALDAELARNTSELHDFEQRWGAATREGRTEATAEDATAASRPAPAAEAPDAGGVDRSLQAVESAVRDVTAKYDELVRQHESLTACRLRARDEKHAGVLGMPAVALQLHTWLNDVLGWTGMRDVRVVFDSTTDEAVPSAFFARLWNRPNVAVVAETAAHDVFGAFYSVPVVRPNAQAFDPSAFVFSFASNGRLPGPAAFKARAGRASDVFVRVFDGGDLLFMAGSESGSFGVGMAQGSRSFCNNLSFVFDGLGADDLVGGTSSLLDATHPAVVRVVAVTLS